MIAGRLHWNGKRQALATLVFDNGTLTLTEAGTQHRAAQIHVLQARLRKLRKLEAGWPPSGGTEFAEALRQGESHVEQVADRSANVQWHRQRLL